MLSKLSFPNGVENQRTHTEGELYKVLDINGHIFEIYYGYYEEFERDNPFISPIPIYPDFIKNPQYTIGGYAFVTKMQDICDNFKGREKKESDCGECEYYSHCAELIGICLCENNKNPSNSVGTEGEQEDAK